MQPSVTSSSLNTDVQAVLQRQLTKAPLSIRRVLENQAYAPVVSKALGDASRDTALVVAVEEEVIMTLLGLQSPQDFEIAIASIPGVTTELLRSVTSAVHRDIFLPLAVNIESIRVNETQTVGTRESASVFDDILQRDTILQSQFNKLPQNAQTTIRSEEFGKAMSDIATHFRLTPDQVLLFTKSSLAALVGAINATTFYERARKDFALPGELFIAFTQTSDQRIFRPVRNAILMTISITGNKNDVGLLQETTPSAPSRQPDRAATRDEINRDPYRESIP